jgi:hypothetical protein
MHRFSRRALLASAAAVTVQTQAQGGTPMLNSAKGTFKVQMKPIGESSTLAGVSTGRMSLDKQFEGDWVAIGQGET